MKRAKLFLCTVIFTILCAVTAWAGTWEKTEDGASRYKNDDGTYLTSTWLQENGKWYFFDENGFLVVDAVIEGYQLGADGAETTGATGISSQYPQVVIAPAETKQTEVTYVLNKNTKKFHKPSCSSVSDMAAKNRLDSGSSRDEIVAQGYVPCKRCHP